eukprot:2632122-Rhodomonas_salina.3
MPGRDVACGALPGGMQQLPVIVPLPEWCEREAALLALGHMYRPNGDIDAARLCKSEPESVGIVLNLLRLSDLWMMDWVKQVTMRATPVHRPALLWPFAMNLLLLYLARADLLPRLTLVSVAVVRRVAGLVCNPRHLERVHAAHARVRVQSSANPGAVHSPHPANVQFCQQDT